MLSAINIFALSVIMGRFKLWGAGGCQEDCLWPRTIGSSTGMCWFRRVGYVMIYSLQ